MAKIITMLCKSKLHIIDRKINQKLFAIKVNYGSKFDDRYIGNEYLPSGTAHFLEHAIFYKEGGHIGENFFDNGAYANAITSYDSTIFYTTINNNMLDSINLLLNVILEKPHLSSINLENEREVIKNEIRQKQNNHLHKASKNLISHMYENKAIINDVTGKEEDIEKIGIDELLVSYFSFYKPENLTFYLMGNLLEPDIKNIDKIINKKIMKAIKNNVYLNSEERVEKCYDNDINLKTFTVENSKENILLGFKRDKKNMFLYEVDFYGKLIGRLLVNVIQIKYTSLEIKEYAVSLGSDYNYIATIWHNNKRNETYDFSFLFDLEKEKKGLTKNIEAEVDNIKRKLNILFDSVDLFFVSYIEKNFYDKTIYDYKCIVDQFDYEKFWEYYRQFINKEGFVYVMVNDEGD